MRLSGFGVQGLGLGVGELRTSDVEGDFHRAAWHCMECKQNMLCTQRVMQKKGCRLQEGAQLK